MGNKSKRSQTRQIQPAAKPKKTPTAEQKTLRVSSKESKFSGPIPDPASLAKYEEIAPGAAERILVMAEKTHAHAIEIEKGILEAKVNDAIRERGEVRLGQILGFIITIVALIAGAYTASTGHELAGSAIGVAGIGGIVTTMISGRRANGKKASKEDEPSEQE